MREPKLIDLPQPTLLEGSAAALHPRPPDGQLARRVEPVIRALRDWNEKNIVNTETPRHAHPQPASPSTQGMPPDATAI